MDDEFSPFLESSVRRNVRAAYGALGGTIQEGQNPIKNIQLIVSGSGGNLYITDLEDDGGDDAEVGIDTARPMIRTNDQNRQGGEVSALFSQMRTVQRNQILLQNEIIHFKATSCDLLTRLHQTIQRIAQAPMFTPRVRIRRQQQYDTQQEEQVENSAVRGLRGSNAIFQTRVDSRAVLSKRPRTLHVLWQEYEFGIAGKKAAKLFTVAERGRNKHAFCLRKPFWELVVSMICHGYTNTTAVDKIYEVYGNKSVVHTLRLIKKDSRTGGHDELSNFVTVEEV